MRGHLAGVRGWRLRDRNPEHPAQHSGIDGQHHPIGKPDFAHRTSPCADAPATSNGFMAAHATVRTAPGGTTICKPYAEAYRDDPTVGQLDVMLGLKPGDRSAAELPSEKRRHQKGYNGNSIEQPPGMPAKSCRGRRFYPARRRYLRCNLFHPRCMPWPARLIGLAGSARRPPAPCGLRLE